MAVLGSKQAAVAVRKRAAVDVEATPRAVTATERMERAFQAHHVAVLRFCTSRLRDHHDAEDAVQEVFARAVRHQDELIGDPLGWLIRTATNVCTDELRRRAHYTADTEPDGVEDREPAETEDPEALVVRRMLISDLLRRLTPGERRVVTDSWLLGAGNPEQTSMGVSTSTTRVLLCRARRRMRTYLDDLQESASLIVFGLWRGRRNRAAGIEAWTGVMRLGVPGLVAATVALSGGGPVPNAADPAGGAGQPAGVALQWTALKSDSPLPASTGAASAAPAATPAHPGARSLALPVSAHQARAQDAVITDMQPSPQYSQDHTILATGTDRTCSSAPCQALFVSHDAGHSWTTLPASNFASTQLLLPPASFAKGHFFGFGAAGLQETTDGGKSFATSLPDLAGFAATQPAGTGSLFSVSNAARWDFTGGQTPTLGSAFLPGWNAAGPPVFLGPSMPALQPVLHATTAAGFNVQVMSCTATCSAGPVLPWSQNTTMAVSPEFAHDQTLLAMNGAALALSTNQGSSFRTVALPSGMSAAAAQVVRGVNAPRVVAIVSAAAAAAGAYYTDDGGTTWSAASLPQPAATAILARPTPNSLIVALTSPLSQTTFACSQDAGASWSAC